MDCPVCNGLRPFCIHKSYPLPKIYEVEKKVKEKLKEDFFGPSYSIFVGSYNYPNISVGPMVALDQMENIDSPNNWFGLEYSQLIEMRAFLLRSQQKENVFSHSRFIEENQELAMAKRPTETEISLKKKPVFNFSFSEYVQPMGPSGNLKKMRITENTKIDIGVEKIVRDEMRAAEAVSTLYDRNQDVYKIMTILSSGVLGVNKRKKLVPTKWSITAIDDIIAKSMIEEIKQMPSVNDFLVFESVYLDNKFIILLIPGSWEFENFETWAPGSNWSAPTNAKIIEEYEPYEGRKSYADKQAGGYYACRIAVVEYLKKICKQSKVIGFREIGEGYSVPVGVWQVRENVRNAMKQQPKKFNTKEDALNYISKRLKVPMSEYNKKSIMLRQRRVFDFC